MKRKINKQKSNKGFSLVELIVVIAIMAVLVGVLTPQFLGYVSRARISTDVQNMDSILRAADVYVADKELQSESEIKNLVSYVITNQQINVESVPSVSDYKLKYSGWVGVSVDYKDGNWVVTGHTKKAVTGKYYYLGGAQASADLNTNYCKNQSHSNCY